jgi:hypothetical protein
MRSERDVVGLCQLPRFGHERRRQAQRELLHSAGELIVQGRQGHRLTTPNRAQVVEAQGYGMSRPGAPVDPLTQANRSLSSGSDRVVRKPPEHAVRMVGIVILWFRRQPGSGECRRNGCNIEPASGQVQDLVLVQRHGDAPQRLAVIELGERRRIVRSRP